MRGAVTNGVVTNVDDADDMAMALRALAWTVADPARAERLLALTGLDAAELRARVDAPAVRADGMGGLGGRAGPGPDPARGARRRARTGREAAERGGRGDEPAVLAAVMGFLEAHEADLVACAGALGVPAPALVAARERLER